ncbi:MAG: hypothetical protein JSS61_05400 [Verrucomicrobia bacterium]|nr:hypothetical protein [Verrucomicrobiota bacterium]
MVAQVVSFLAAPFADTYTLCTTPDACAYWRVHAYITTVGLISTLSPSPLLTMPIAHLGGCTAHKFLELFHKSAKIDPNS